MPKKLATPESALKTAANSGDLKSITTIINNLTPAEQSAIKPNVYKRALLSIADSGAESADPAADSLATSTARNFMQRVGAFVDSHTIGKAMETFASDHNFTGLNSMVDYLATAQKASIKPSFINHTLEAIADSTFTVGEGADTATAAALHDFMSKMGPYASGKAIGGTLLTLAEDKNFDALNTVIDFVTDAQKAAIKPHDIDETLLQIVGSAHESSPDTPAATDAIINNFMHELGSYVRGQAVGEAMVTLAKDGDFTTLDAVTDKLSSTQKADIHSDDIGETLNLIIDFTPESGGTETNDVINNALHDFMSKFGSYVDKSQLAEAVDSLLHNHNPEGVEIILDNVSDQMASFIQDGHQCLLNDVPTGVHDPSTGTDGNDVIVARDGEGQLYGGTGLDFLYGDAGNNILNGGADTDSLMGGAGADKFVFDSATGVDTVFDFNANEGDSLDFSTLLADFDPVTEAITDFVTKTTIDGSTTISVDVDGQGAGTAVAVVTLQNVADIDIQAQFNQGHIIA